MKKFLCLISLFLLGVTLYASPITGLLERIDKGASRKFVIERLKGEKDFFELDQKGNKVVVRGNNYVSIATGINWYLKYYAGINLSWNGMQADLPEVLPPVLKKERHETDLKLRYDFNYCTFSYSMAFWDWKRWEQEIDWMALHGINLPLAMVGTDVVWKNVLEELGYTREEINAFIAGPGFQAWWLMNNLEGWGGPNPDSWYERQEELQKRILKRMREYGIEPVLPGYSGMVPHNAKDRLGLNVADPGRWNGYPRPAFLQPTDPQFERIAALYYREMTLLYGKASYYSMDPFHEGGNTSGVDLEAAGKAIWKAMKQANPRAAWVVQAWGANPRPQMYRFFAISSGSSTERIELGIESARRRKRSRKYPQRQFVRIRLIFLRIRIIAIQQRADGIKILVRSSLHHHHDAPLMEHILDVSQQIGIRLNPVNVLPGKEERVANLHLLSRSIRNRLLVTVYHVLGYHMVFFAPERKVIKRVVVCYA